MWSIQLTLLGHLPAMLVRGTLGVGGVGALLWGPWKGVMEGRPGHGGRTENWGVVISSHVPLPQGASLPAIQAFGWWPVPPEPVQPQVHTWLVRSVSRSSDTSSLSSSRRTILCRSSSSMKPFSLKSAKRRRGLRARRHQPGPHRHPSACGVPAERSRPRGPSAWHSARPGRPGRRALQQGSLPVKAVLSNVEERQAAAVIVCHLFKPGLGVSPD